MFSPFCLFCLLLASFHAEEISSQKGLDDYLGACGTTVTEGYCTLPQEKQFFEALNPRKETIRKVLEIGFNAGHSCEFFLKNLPHSKVVSFDICHHPYTQIGLKYIQEHYKDRLTFIAGNSVLAIPKYASDHPGEKFDLIYVDADHSYNGCLIDIVNCKALADKETILLIDDYHFSSVSKAVADCVEQKVIRVVSDQKSHDPKHDWRHWVEARYVFN